MKKELSFVKCDDSGLVDLSTHLICQGVLGGILNNSS